MPSAKGLGPNSTLTQHSVFAGVDSRRFVPPPLGNCGYETPLLVPDQGVRAAPAGVHQLPSLGMHVVEVLGAALVNGSVRIGYEVLLSIRRAGSYRWTLLERDDNEQHYDSNQAQTSDVVFHDLSGDPLG